MNSNTLRAKSLLVHYFRLVATKSGVGWDSDNIMELEQLVDLIIDAAVDEIRAEKDGEAKMTITPPAAASAPLPLWTDSQITFRYHASFDDRALMREMRDDYERDRAILRQQIAELQQELLAYKEQAVADGWAIADLDAL